MSYITDITKRRSPIGAIGYLQNNNKNKDDMYRERTNIIDKLKDYIILLRPKHWMKNSFAFTALIFSNNLGRFDLWIRVIETFLILNFLSSAVYIVNDIVDRERDKFNSKKRNRPITAGRINITTALFLSIVILLSTLYFSFLLDKRLFLLAVLYFLIMMFYTFYLKNKVIVDVFCISMGFVIRVVAGAFVINVLPSKWLIMCTFFLAVFLGFSKRRYEYVTLSKDMCNHRSVLKFYNVNFLDQMNMIAMCMVVVCYLLYTVAPETVARFNTQTLAFSTIFVVFGLFRYLFLVHKKSKGSPVETLFSDRQLVAIVLLWALYCIVIIRYLPYIETALKAGGIL